jgi:hypothetical protein
MTKYYLKTIGRIQAKNRYLRTAAGLDPRTADDIGVPVQDTGPALPACKNLTNAMIASRFTGGWGLSRHWNNCW